MEGGLVVACDQATSSLTAHGSKFADGVRCGYTTAAVAKIGERP